MCVRVVICREGGTPSSAAGRRRLPARRPPSPTPRHNQLQPKQIVGRAPRTNRDRMAATLQLAALCCACMITAATTARTAFAANSARALAAPGLRLSSAASFRGAGPEARRTRVHAAAGARALVDVVGEGGGDADARITVLKAKLATALQGVVRELPQAAMMLMWRYII
jgi:hypothetical protein